QNSQEDSLMHAKSLTELRAALAAKECSAVELAQHYLKRIDAAREFGIGGLRLREGEFGLDVDERVQVARG
ncbi:hypothetical protein, partial [Burkholderia multivorans]|uniref:hypothetical protein n=1 Tax=Burkholderia multivorans TaxID=87883 RepID=UPI0011B7A4FC